MLTPAAAVLGPSGFEGVLQVTGSTNQLLTSECEPNCFWSDRQVRVVRPCFWRHVYCSCLHVSRVETILYTCGHTVLAGHAPGQGEQYTARWTSTYLHLVGV